MTENIALFFRRLFWRPKVIRLAINGARGRMGARLCALAGEDERFELVAALDADAPPASLNDAALDAVIDFSSDAGAAEAVALARRARAAVLIGTTALSPQTLHALDDASTEIPVLLAANTSVGVAVMKHLAREAARLLGGVFDVSMIEYHHAAKTDAPSGTALRLIEAVESGGGAVDRSNVAAARVGDIVGEHTLRFSGPGEYLEITHRATTRDLFVRGALRACGWLVEQRPGRYTIEDAIGLM